MTDQAKHPADTVVPTDVAPTICSAQYPVALVDVLGRSFEKWLQQLKVSIRVREDCRCVAARVSSQFSEPGLLARVCFRSGFRYVSDMFQIAFLKCRRGAHWGLVFGLYCCRGCNQPKLEVEGGWWD